ncbi:PxKF domain-containing protein [Planococcus sp. X10-3]|uniref:PxKF domain-containing protein n=1 Tax=Planococcus sp. X10-3 TaxID=3061240 RepID=UPI003BB0318C
MGKKAVRLFAVLMILMLSGVLTTISAIAYELVVVPEFQVTTDKVIELKKGETTKINILLSYSNAHHNNTKGTISVDSLFEIQGDHVSSSVPKSVSFEGASFESIVEGTINIGNANPGTYELQVNTVITNTGNGNHKLENYQSDKISVRVLPSDTTAPVVNITNPADGGFYNSAELPDEPAFTVTDESGYDSSISGWSKSEGTHLLTVSATDAHENLGSASVTYTVDDTPPTITTQIEDGGVYNSASLEDLVDSYYTVSDSNLESFFGDPLSLEDGEQSVKIVAADKAGNQSDKVISYMIDNESPAITFQFQDGGFYTSDNFQKFNPYFEVTDSNLDSNSITASDAGLAEGTQTVTVSAADQAGNSNSASASYTIDDTKPEVTFNLIDGFYYNESALAAVGEFYTVSDLNLFSSDATGFGSADGNYTAVVTAQDKAGNVTGKTVSYVVDTTSPTIQFDAEKLANGGFYQSAYLENLADFYSIEDTNLDEASTTVSSFETAEGTHTFSVSAMDKAGNRSVETVSYTVDNSAPELVFNVEEGAFYKSSDLPETYFSASDNNKLTSVVADSFNKTEGTHVLEVTLMDAAGNSTTGTVSYTVDDTAPVVSISEPADGGFYNSADLPDQLKFTVDETHSFTTNILGWNKETEGTHTATVAATDVVGNIGEAFVTYTVDNTSPEITSVLVNGGYYNAETLQSLGVYYEVSDLNLKDESVIASELVLTEGPQTAVIKAVDKAGNSSEKTIEYTVDNTKPTIAFQFNDGGFYTTEDFTAFDPYYTVEDENLDEGSIEDSGVSFAEGQNSLTVSASDLAKNANSATADYTIDNTDPEVSVTLEEGKYYNLGSLEALGQYWSATDANLEGVDADKLATTDGAHTATVTAIDKAGNTTEVSVNYIVDNTPPAILFDESVLKDGGFYTASYLDALVEKPYSVVDANPASDSASEFVYEEGTHDYTVTATDQAGNVTAKTISYHVDNTAPVIQIDLAENGVYTSQYLNDFGQYYAVSDNSNETVQATADQLETGTDGTFTATVTATDLAGNSSSAAVTYTVDDTNPEITFQLVEGKHYTSASLEAAVTGHENYYTASDTHLISVQGDPLETAEGKHELSVEAVDAAGNKTTAFISYVVDNTAPTFSGLQGLFDGQRFLTGQDVDVIPVIADNFDENISVETVKLDTSKTGKQTVTVTATDQAGNSASYTMSYHVYDFSGVLQPFKADGKNVFQKNRTVPVKFQIFDGSNYVQDASATIHLVKVSDTAEDGEIQVTSTSGASVGNLFRYDSKDEQYIFNLGTKELEKVQYKAVITITLDGNKIYKESATFSIK